MPRDAQTQKEAAEREVVFGAEEIKDWFRQMLREVERGNLDEIRKQLREAISKI